ncbi:MAG: cytochrome c biogenesis protein CcsA [Planctomycetota bacterium]
MNVTVFCFFASYVVAFAAESARLVRGWAALRVVVLGFIAAGVFAHTLFLLRQSSEAGLPPLLSSAQDWILVLAWVMSVAGLVLALLDDRPAIGIFLIPTVLLLIGASLLTAGPTPSSTEYELTLATKRWAILHAALILFGIAAVLGGLASSLMYLAQHRRLKSKRLTPASDMAMFSLEQLARWNRYAMISAVILLALGLAAGAALGAVSERVTALSWFDPLVLAGSAGWVGLTGFLLWLLRSGSDMSGRIIATRTVLVCGLLLVTIVGVQVLAGGRVSLSGWHS